jgi:hypothetical protein
VAPARGDHRLAFALVDRERLLAQDVDAAPRRALGEVAVLVVGQRDVHRIDGTAFEQRVVLGIVVGRDAVFLRELLALLRVAGDQRHQARVAPRMAERG